MIVITRAWLSPSNGWCWGADCDGTSGRSTSATSPRKGSSLPARRGTPRRAVPRDPRVVAGSPRPSIEKFARALDDLHGSLTARRADRAGKITPSRLPSNRSTRTRSATGSSSAWSVSSPRWSCALAPRAFVQVFRAARTGSKHRSVTLPRCTAVSPGGVLSVSWPGSGVPRSSSLHRPRSTSSSRGGHHRAGHRDRTGCARRSVVWKLVGVDDVRRRGHLHPVVRRRRRSRAGGAAFLPRWRDRHRHYAGTGHNQPLARGRSPSPPPEAPGHHSPIVADPAPADRRPREASAGQVQGPCGGGASQHSPGHGPRTCLTLRGSANPAGARAVNAHELKPVASPMARLNRMIKSTTTPGSIQIVANIGLKLLRQLTARHRAGVRHYATRDDRGGFSPGRRGHRRALSACRVHRRAEDWSVSRCPEAPRAARRSRQPVLRT